MASKHKPVSIDTKLQVLDEVDKKVKAKTQIGVWCSTLSVVEEIMKENVELKDEINCWFSSSYQRLGTHLLHVLLKLG